VQIPRFRAACGILAWTCVGASAGAQWTFAASGTTAEFRGLSVVNDRVVWASGARGTVARSEDGGVTWRTDTVPGATHLDFRSIDAIDANTAFIASAGEAEKGLAAIYVTRDAGRTWRRVYSTDTRGVFFDAIAFWDDQRGMALSDPVDSAFVLLETRDGGASWSRIPPASLPRVLPGEAAFAASGGSLVLGGDGAMRIGTGGGGRGRVMLSRDYGRSWRVVDTPVHAAGGAAGIFAIDFVDGGEAVAVGGDYTQPNLAAISVALSRDGGQTWRAARAPAPAYLSSVSFERGGNALVAVGLAGTFVSRDGGETWRHTSTVPLNTVVASSKGWFAVGPAGRIARGQP
jgi:photosystem II stability/assembly factor-like uncharacterized protein